MPLRGPPRVLTTAPGRILITPGLILLHNAPRHSPRPLVPAPGEPDEVGVGIESGGRCDPRSTAASSSRMRSRTREAVSGASAPGSVWSCAGDAGRDITKLRAANCK